MAPIDTCVSASSLANMSSGKHSFSRWLWLALGHTFSCGSVNLGAHLIADPPEVLINSAAPSALDSRFKLIILVQVGAFCSLELGNKVLRFLRAAAKIGIQLRKLLQNIDARDAAPRSSEDANLPTNRNGKSTPIRMDLWR